MTLTAKQQIAIAKAPAGQKQQLRNMYHRQQLNKNGNNNNNKPQQRMLRQPPGLSRANTRPRPGPKPAPKRQPTKPMRIPNYLDPLCTLPVPSALSDGKALPHTGIIRKNFATIPGDVNLIVVQNTGDSGTIGYRVRLSQSGAHIGESLLTIPTMAASAAQGGPSACRAMKCSASLVNSSNVMHRGGRVMYLNSAQRLPTRMSQTDLVQNPFGDPEFSHIVDAVRNSPYTRGVTGDFLKVPFQLISFPIDPVSYSQFKPSRGILTSAEFRDHIFMPPLETLNDQEVRPMSTLVFLIESTDEAQDYTLTIRGSYYTRWPLTSIPGQSMQHMPTAPANVINKVRDHAETNAQELVKVAEDFKLPTRGNEPWVGSE